MQLGGAGANTIVRLPGADSESPLAGGVGSLFSVVGRHHIVDKV